ncbi:endopeptidase La [Thioalkalivibrio sp.]|uniref:endopeptidase La n=1 Tax=Thioalkalivibrio sp. TaxID=2093813 RepID=UPI0012D6A2C8|nr:endopeptidase La [Thioalkalivibrio sp.]TVP78690.1 MAG: endopeptidase La [Thioalkalivibrio sp.]
MNNDTASAVYVLPLFPLRRTVLFPTIAGPFAAGRKGSIAALEFASASEDKNLITATQRDTDVDTPSADDLHRFATRGVVRRLFRSEETLEVIIEGLERIRIQNVEQEGDRLMAHAIPAPVVLEPGPESEALKREIISLMGEFQALVPQLAQFNVEALLEKARDPMHLVYLLGALLELDYEKAQRLLDASEQNQAMKLLLGYMRKEYEVLKLRREIAGEAESEAGQEQRKYMLRQQMKAIQKELGEAGDGDTASQELRERLEQAELPEPVREEAERELGRLEGTPPASPEHGVIRNRLELILDLPWKRRTEDNLNLARARQVLDADHYDLTEIKERILEQLAVLRLNPEAKASILCFVGPPGVGKTSLGQSIARALGREFERFSLGGLRDEAELRGHRRTYVGAMPGRIIQAMRRAGSANPLLMLDEVDKLGQDFRGDPASALLEILDPAQNYEFRDNYLDLPFDLSRVLFITTANTLEPIPGPLLDRMEVLRLSGYSDEEKLEIARRYILERQRLQSGLAQEQFKVPEETILRIIRHYTREAGVRELERRIGRLARKIALRIAEEREIPDTISPDLLHELLGRERFRPEEARRKVPPGVATGLAWTPTGGDVLYVEAILLPEEGKLTLTGQLGDVMKESAQAAQNWVLSQSDRLNIKHPRAGLHIHVPAGAIPKDGPSAGVTMAVAVASIYSGRHTRADTAMTGEITLSGLVLPVGGVKEKVLAARRTGLRRVILPRQNEKDLDDLPDTVREEMEFVLADRIDNVLRAAIPGLLPEAESAEPVESSSSEP